MYLMFLARMASADQIHDKIFSVSARAYYVIPAATQPGVPAAGTAYFYRLSIDLRYANRYSEMIR